MGVKGYQVWLKNKFKEHFGSNYAKFMKAAKCRRLFLDYNGIIHLAITIVYTSDDPLERDDMKNEPAAYWTKPGGVYDTVFEIIEELNMLCKPSFLLYLAADGVVTRAKMMQQRQRTYLEVVGGDHAFDRSQVKPGTEFMNGLAKYLKNRIVREVNNNRLAWPEMIKFSDHDLPGEGEHKISNAFTSEHADRRSAAYNMAYDIVYSQDADLSFLTMLHAGSGDNVAVIRHDHFWDFRDIENPDKWQIYDSTAIRKKLYAIYGDPIDDFVVCCMFAGNDFLPGFPFSMGKRSKVFDAIEETYKLTFGNVRGPHIVKGMEINWANLTAYLNNLWIKEANILRDMEEFQRNRPDYFQIKDEDDQIVEDRRWDILQKAAEFKRKGRNVGAEDLDDNEDEADAEDETKTGDVGYDFDYIAFREMYRMYVNGLFEPVEDLDIKQNFIPEMCQSYIAGIWYVLTYYRSQGENINLDWAYPFHYPPTVWDMMEFLKNNGSKKNIDDWIDEAALGSKKFVTPYEHLIAILPKEKLYLLPNVVKSKFLTEMPDLYPSEFEVDRTYVFTGENSNLGDAKILLNFPSLPRISRMFDSVRAIVDYKPGRMWSKTNNRTQKGYK